jgi:catechol 2,3-dioxygenase-like lactoylglutathione lyase family enzyme
MNLGSFSVSPTVSDLQASKAFYATLGFAEVHGETSQAVGQIA